jgi:hypothetical protein
MSETLVCRRGAAQPTHPRWENKSTFWIVPSAGRSCGRKHSFQRKTSTSGSSSALFEAASLVLDEWVPKPFLLAQYCLLILLQVPAWLIKSAGRLGNRLATRVHCAFAHDQVS